MRNKGLAVALVILVILASIGLSVSRRYNKLVIMDESIDGSWGEIENQLQRRADLIPNLLEVVKGYASHEEEVIKSISDARAGYSSASTPKEYAAAEEKLNESIKSLNIIVENYPDLKANQNFKDLQVELAGTENRIATARMRYNEMVQRYNETIRQLPNNIIASMFGFERKDYFQINESAREVPKIKF